MVRPYLSNIINDHETQVELKIQSAIAINFMSSKDSNEMVLCTLRAIAYKLNRWNYSRTFWFFLQKYQKGLKESMKESAFVFDSVDLLRYKLHEISLNRGGSYIDYPKWLKNEKTSINPKNTSSML